MDEKKLLKKYEQLKRRVDAAKSEADKAQGALDNLMARLESQFECSTVSDAKVKAEELRERAEELEDDFNEALAAFEEEWGNE